MKIESIQSEQNIRQEPRQAETLTKLQTNLDSHQATCLFTFKSMKFSATILVTLDKNVNEPTLLKGVNITQNSNQYGQCQDWPQAVRHVIGRITSCVVFVHGNLDICCAVSSANLEGTVPIESITIEFVGQV